MIKRIKGFCEFYKDIFQFIWEEVITKVAITTYIRNPCNSNKCLVRACCTENCPGRIRYLNHCDSSGTIIFQRICAYAVIFGLVTVGWGIVTLIYKH